MASLHSTDRRRSHSRMIALAMSTILCSGLAAPAWGQTSTTVDTVDENGIDLSSNGFTDQHEDISIGVGQFPARLYSGTDGVSNLNAVITAGGSALTGSSPVYTVTVGRISRTFTSYAPNTAPLVPQPGQYLPLDRRGGYLMRTTEGTTTVFTYYSTAGEQLRFVVADNAACGRAITAQAGSPLTCARIARWTAPNGVYADYTYVTRSGNAFLGQYNETDLIKVSNTLGLTLDLGYTSFKDSGQYTDPVYGLTSILASSNQLGTCNAQPSCSRTVTYQYGVAPPIDPNSLGNTQIYLTGITNSLNQTTQYTYTQLSNGQEYLTSIRRPANPTVDAIKHVGGVGGGPLQLVDAFGNTWGYSRVIDSTSHHVTTTRTDPLNKTRIYEFDAQSNLIRFQDEMSQTTLWEYDGYGRLTKTTLPNGIVIIPAYDTRGNVTSITTKAVPSTPSVPDIVTGATFDTDCTNVKTCNQPNTITDAKGNVTNYTYDPTHGGVLTLTAPAAVAGQPRPQTRFTYGLVSGAYVLTGTSTCRTTASCSGTADETKTTLTYGTTGLLLPTSTSVSSGDGTLQSTVADTYDAFGNLTSEDGPLAGAADTTYRRFDRLGRVVGTIRPDPDGTGPLVRAASRITYDADGNVTKKEIGTVAGVTDTDWTAFNSKQTVSSTFDADDRRTSDTLTANGTTYGVTQYSYDAASRLDCTAVRMNNAVWGSLPTSACTLQAAGSAGSDRVTKTGYDNVDRVTKVTTGFGTSTPVDEITTTYTATGKAANATDAKGNITTYAYDGFDRLSTITYPGGSYEQLGYDANDNITSLRLRDGTSMAYSFDNLNRVTAKTLPNSEPGASYTYDLLGHPLTATQDTTLAYGWDALGRMTSEVQPFGSMSYQYDASDNRTRATWQDGFYVTYGYDNANQLTSIKENGSTSLATFTYDDLGRRASLTRGNGVVTNYSYDPVSRLVGLSDDFAGTADDQNVTLTYTPAGQIASSTRSNPSYAFTGYVGVSRSYTANPLNQYTNAGGTAFGHDGRGNLNTSGSSTFGYSSENRLKSASGGISLYYDPAGQLVEYDTSTSTRLMYNNGQIAAEIANPSGAITKRYVFGPGADEPLVEYDASGTKTYLVADERGSIVARTNLSGAVTVKNSYDEFGIPGAGNQGRFQYTGQAWLNELGMAFYKARVYSPSLGRFVQTDPLGYGDGMNWYNYAHADPINGIDPTGLADCRDCYGLPPIYGPYQPGSPGDSGPAYGPGYGNGATWDFSGQNALFAIARNTPKVTRGAARASNYIIAQLVQKQQDTCRTDPLFASALADPKFRAQLKASVAQSDATPSDDDPKTKAEFGFYYGMTNGKSAVTPTFTDKQSTHINLAGYPFSNIWAWSHGVSTIVILSHVHPVSADSEPGLSGADARTARALKVGIVAVDPDGTVYCYNGGAKK